MNGHDEEAIRATEPTPEEQELEEIEARLTELNAQRQYIEQELDQSGATPQVEGGKQTPEVPDHRDDVGIF